MDFLETLETLRASDAEVGKLFNSREDGQGVRSARKGGNWNAMLGEAAGLIADVMEGRRPTYHLREALGTSDFPLLFGDIIDRQLLANYQEWPVTYPNYARVRTVRDFRTVNRFAIDGAESRLLTVNEQEEYPGSSLSETRYQYSVSKYGRRIPFSWEAMINDDLDALKDIPERFGRAARRTEEHFVTGLFVDASGPHASLYTSGNANIVNTTNGASETNPALDITALQDAMIVLGAQTDADGEPIVMESVELVVPPALEVTAMNILNALEIRAASAGGDSNQTLVAVNWMRNRVRLSVNPYIPIIAATNGNTSWFLFANPNQGRPALEVGKLRGHETPEVFIKTPNALRAGGGPAAPMDGDFDTDSVEYKVRMVFGGARIDGKATVGSNGSGA